MSIFKRLLGQKKQVIEPMHGVAPLQTEAEQDAIRNRLEREMAAQKALRSERAAGGKA